MSPSIAREGGVAASEPRLSVIISTLQAGATMRACLDSLQRQKDAPPFEVVISDGGSTDETLPTIEAYSDIVAHLRSGTDKGIYDAWNLVLPDVRGTWWLFLGADDVLAGPYVLRDVERALRSQQAHAGYAVFACKMLGRPPRTIRRTKATIQQRFSRGQMGFTHSSTWHHRSLFSEFGVFDDSYQIAGDFEFALRTRRSPLHAFPDLITTLMRRGGISDRHDMALALQHEYRRARRQHGFSSFTPRHATSMTAAAVRAAAGGIADSASRLRRKSTETR